MTTSPHSTWRRSAATAAAVAMALLAIAQIRAQESPSEIGVFGGPERLAARLRAWREGLDYVPGEVLVKFRDGVSSTEVASVLRLARHGGQPVKTEWLHDILHARAEGEDDVRDLVVQLERQPEVEWAQPNFISRVASVPNDPSYPQQWHMAVLDMPRAWDISDGGSASVTVAVIDTGLTVSNFNLSLRVWNGLAFPITTMPFTANPEISSSRIVEARDFRLSGVPMFDAQGHGSHVAGTVLQDTGNGIGVAGMAPRTKLLALKACLGEWDINFLLASAFVPGRVDYTSCDTDAVVSAIQYAASRGANVINLSLGGTNVSPAYQTALRDARNQGVFVAIAAGNGFVSNNNATEYPAFYARDLDGVMAVGAVTRGLTRSYYSNTGNHVEIAAPGGDVRQGDAGGVIQFAVNPADMFSTILAPRFDRYVARSMQGTSMASPHVAGLAALLYSQGVTNPAAVEAAIKRYARDLGPAGRDNDFGFGLIDPPATLRGLGYLR